MLYSHFIQYAKEHSNHLGHQGLKYIDFHAKRFYDTYNICTKLLKNKDSLISIGAGSAIVEKVLAKTLNIDVMVVDFPNAINLNKKYYDALGFNTMSLDLLEDVIELPGNTYDLLLCAEIIEHVPKSPFEQLTKFKDTIKTGGKIVITTPNMGSIAHLGKVLLMRPLLPPAEQTFSPVSFENEGVHRREYMACEIISALEKLKFRHLTTKYIYYGTPQRPRNIPLFAIGKIIPRFRPAMLIVGEKL